MKQRPRSAPPPSLKKLSREDAKQAILDSYKTQPLLVGVTAIQLGSLWSLGETDGLFQELQEEGRLRPLSELEKRQYGLADGYVPSGVASKR